MKHLFIINPKSCRGKALKYAEKIKEHFEGTKDIYFIEFTKAPGDASRIAREYVSSDDFRVYSVGGDGTLNEVLNGIVNSSSSLAVIPAGSGNDFFNNIESKIDKTILSRTINGTDKLIDIGTVNGRYFLSVASVGLDAQIVINSNKFRKTPLFHGMASYIAGIFYTVFTYRSFKSKVTIGDLQFDKQTEMMAVANAKYYGGGMMVAPKADFNDGIFEVYHVDKINPLKVVFLFPKIIKGTHESIKQVSYYRANRVSISSDKEFSLNIDGEVDRVKEAIFDIIPNGVRMVFPAKIESNGIDERVL